MCTRTRNDFRSPARVNSFCLVAMGPDPSFALYCLAITAQRPNCLRLKHHWNVHKSHISCSIPLHLSPSALSIVPIHYFASYYFSHGFNPCARSQVWLHVIPCFLRQKETGSLAGRHTHNQILCDGDLCVECVVTCCVTGETNLCEVVLEEKGGRRGRGI
jgi:hypothetical protein